jgi:hypothetical protein
MRDPHNPLEFRALLHSRPMKKKKKKKKKREK